MGAECRALLAVHIDNTHVRIRNSFAFCIFVYQLAATQIVAHRIGASFKIALKQTLNIEWLVLEEVDKILSNRSKKMRRFISLRPNKIFDDFATSSANHPDYLAFSECATEIITRDTMFI